jgi:hypothetical protein
MSDREKVVNAAKKLVAMIDQNEKGVASWHTACEDAYQKLLSTLTEPQEPVARVLVYDPTGYGPEYRLKVLGDLPFGEHHLYLHPSRERDHEAMERLRQDDGRTTLLFFRGVGHGLARGWHWKTGPFDDPADAILAGEEADDGTD